MSQPFLFLPIEFSPQGAALAAPTDPTVPIVIPNEREGVVRPEADDGGKSQGQKKHRPVPAKSVVSLSAEPAVGIFFWCCHANPFLQARSGH